MALEAYRSPRVWLAGREVAECFAVTLRDPDSEAPHGTLTTHHPPPEGSRSGPLIVEGRRDEAAWRVTLPEIEVYRASAVGCEFNIFGKVEREKLAES